MTTNQLKQVGLMLYSKETGECYIDINNEPRRLEQGFLSAVDKLNKEGYRLFKDDTSRHYGEVTKIMRAI